MRTSRLFVLLLLVVSCRIGWGQATPQAVAHRGLLRHAPENTLAAFDACLALRMGFEVDVRRSADGMLVCVHDETLDRTTDGTGPVAGQTLSQLKQLDAGSWFAPAFQGERIPSFAEVLDRVRTAGHPETIVAVDLKAEAIEADVIQAGRAAGVLDRLLMIGSAIRSPDIRRRLREADPDCHVAVVAESPQELAAAIDDPFSDWVYVRYLPTAEETARVREAGKRTFIAGPTVAGNEPENWRVTIASRLDGVLTDHPLAFHRLRRDGQTASATR